MRGLDLGVGPVVADPVAVAVTTQEALGPRATRIVGLPLLGLSHHPALDHGEQVGSLTFGDQLVFDGGQREQGLPHREGQPRSHLEDGPVVLHERLEVRRCLVVRGVGLEDQPRVIVEDAAQLRRGGTLVVDDTQVVELHPRLHDEGDDPAPRVLQTRPREGPLVMGERGPRRVGRRGRQLRQRLVRAAGDGHLGADDVEEISNTRVGLFRLPGQPGRAFGHHVVAQGCRVVGAGHAAVEVDLGEPGGDVGFDKTLRLRHRFLGGELLPPVRAEVVAAQYDSIFRQPVASGYPQHERPEVRRRHPRIAAELIHLIRRGLNKEVAPIVERL